jgi:hypothetical protein
MRKITQDIKKVNSKVDAWELSIIKQISCSEDEVSKHSLQFLPTLLLILPRIAKGESVKNLEIPGKGADSIGDQLNWSKFLPFPGKKTAMDHSRDSDYGITHDDQGFLNCFLYEELCEIVSTLKSISLKILLQA